MGLNTQEDGHFPLHSCHSLHVPPTPLPCTLHGSDATDAAVILPLVVFLSTLAKVKMCAAIDHPYNRISIRIYFRCLLQIAACQIQSKDHKTPGLWVLCNPVKVFRTTLLDAITRFTIVSYPANTYSNSPALHIYNLPDTYNDYDTNDADSDATSSMDARDARDVHAFQPLSQGDAHLTTTNACEIAVDRPPDVLEAPGEDSIEFDSRFSSTSSVLVESFPFGNPGAPIPGMPEEPSYKQSHATPWAPFRSQRDWDIARWAKMHSTTSSAVADLLALPDVCATQSS